MKCTSVTKESNFMEWMKDEAGTCCNLDWNGILGSNLAEKLQTLYVVLTRMQHITKKVSGQVPNVLVVQPLVAAILQVGGVTTNSFDGPFTNTVAPCPEKLLNSKYPYFARAWDKWQILVEEESYMEHRIFMTNLVDGELSDDPKMWCKISLLNLVMSNNFGYYNMC